MTRTIRVTVNGRDHERAVEPRQTLADFLREDLELTGTHVGCEHGVCGACTVWLDGEPVRACLMLAVQADGREVTTVEGLAQGGRLHPLQEEFLKLSSFQCGYCAPGFVLSAKALLDETPNPTEAEIREAIAGNLCRCTAYVGIVKAIQEFASAGRS